MEINRLVHSRVHWARQEDAEGERGRMAGWHLNGNCRSGSVESSEGGAGWAGGWCAGCSQSGSVRVSLDTTATVYKGLQTASGSTTECEVPLSRTHQPVLASPPLAMASPAR